LTLVTFAGAEPACRTKSFCLSLVASPHYQPPGRANGTTNNGATNRYGSGGCRWRSVSTAAKML